MELKESSVEIKEEFRKKRVRQIIAAVPMILAIIGLV